MLRLDIHVPPIEIDAWVKEEAAVIKDRINYQIQRRHSATIEYT